MTVARRRPIAAGLALDGDARPVADLLAGAGQGVEQRRLAAVGIADEADGRSLPCAHIRSTCSSCASSRRRLIGVAADVQLHRIAERRQADDRELGAGGQAHGQQPLAIAAVAAPEADRRGRDRRRRDRPGCRGRHYRVQVDARRPDADDQWRCAIRCRGETLSRARRPAAVAGRRVRTVSSLPTGRPRSASLRSTPRPLA